jgi:hypothetical protein
VRSRNGPFDGLDHVYTRKGLNGVKAGEYGVEGEHGLGLFAARELIQKGADNGDASAALTKVGDGDCPFEGLEGSHNRNGLNGVIEIRRGVHREQRLKLAQTRKLFKNAVEKRDASITLAQVWDGDLPFNGLDFADTGKGLDQVEAVDGVERNRWQNLVHDGEFIKNRAGDGDLIATVEE